MLSLILLLRDVAPLRVDSRFSVLILTHFNARHLDEIRIFVEDKHPHILCLNETKIYVSISDDNTEIEDYIVSRKDRNGFGVVAIYIHSSIQFMLREDMKDLNLEIISVELNLPFIKLIVLI